MKIPRLSLNPNPKVWLVVVGLLVAAVGAQAILNESGIRTMWKKYYGGDAGSADPFGEMLDWMTNRTPSTLQFTATWAVPSLVTNQATSTTIAATGSLDGMLALPSFAGVGATTNLTISARAYSNNVVVTIHNSQGANWGGNTGTVRVLVFQ